jgi:hypothetical protein
MPLLVYIAPAVLQSHCGAGLCIVMSTCYSKQSSCELRLATQLQQAAGVLPGPYHGEVAHNQGQKNDTHAGLLHEMQELAGRLAGAIHPPHQ